MSQQGNQSQDKPEKSNDRLMHLQLSFEESVFGVQKEIEFPVFDDCPECRGTGSLGTGTDICRRCNGTGFVRLVNARHPEITKKEPCKVCGGTGKISGSRCKKCDGTGKREIHRKSLVVIPAGVETGTRLRLKGMGDAGSQRLPPGDLYLELDVTSHPKFRREGNDLITWYEVSPAQAIFGCSIPVQTVDRRTLSVKIPAGISYGWRLRIPGEGIRAKENPGDLFVMIMISTPKNLSGKERELYEKIYTLENGGTVEDSGTTDKPETAKPECPADVAKFALDIVEILDNFERALKSDDRNLREGLAQIHKFSLSVLSRNGIEQMDAAGKQFDPAFHEAVSVLQSHRPDGEIVDVVVPGYMLNDKVLRHAKVTVSKNTEK